ncbi:MAG: acylphosphatase [Leptospirales bacterium]|nr:acylphosphatase [Leptospirales bacterium]
MPKKLTLRGRVQGVGCRQYCQSYAEDFDISGSATNKADGSVELLLNTDDEALLEDFKSALLSNPSNYLFWGRITGIKSEDYNGRFSGDYVF